MVDSLIDWYGESKKENVNYINKSVDKRAGDGRAGITVNSLIDWYGGGEKNIRKNTDIKPDNPGCIICGAKALDREPDCASSDTCANVWLARV